MDWNEEDDYYYYQERRQERERMEDMWDAVTDGMEGDMPEGWDGDLDFIGRG